MRTLLFFKIPSGAGHLDSLSFKNNGVLDKLSLEKVIFIN